MNVNFDESLNIEEVISNTPMQEKKTFLFGTVPFRPLHIGFDPMINLIRFLIINCSLEPIIIIGDTFAHTDKNANISTGPYKKVIKYYEFFLCSAGVKRKNIILHSSSLAKPKYLNMLFEIAEHFRRREMIRTSPRKKINLSDYLSTFMHPLLQIVDVNYHKPDLIVSFSSQRRIYVNLKNILRKTNSNSNPDFIYLRELLDLKGRSLSNSNSGTRISYHENEKSLRKKIGKISFKNRQILRDIYVISIYPFLPDKTFNLTKLTVDNFLKKFPSISRHEFQELKGFSVTLLKMRFDKYRKQFKKHPDWVSWINFDKIRNK